MDLKITIIIPCYNREEYVEKCLVSAATQTYENKEIIFMDNESTDQSLEIAKKVQKNFPEIIVDVAKNIYPHSWQDPVEKALSISTGDYFTIFGSDDFAEPTYIENAMKYISVAPDRVNFFQSPMKGVLKNGETPAGELAHRYNDLDEFKRLLFEKQPVNTPTVIYKKSLYDEGVVSWRSEEYLGAIDYDSFFRIADHGHFIFPSPKWLGYYYRWNDSQLTWVMHNQDQNYDVKIKTYWKNRWQMEEAE